MPIRGPPNTATQQSSKRLAPLSYSELSAQAQPSAPQAPAERDQRVHGTNAAPALLAVQSSTAHQPTHGRSEAAGAGLSPSIFTATQQVGLGPSAAIQGTLFKPRPVRIGGLQQPLSFAQNLGRSQNPELQRRASVATVKGHTPRPNAIPTDAHARNFLPGQQSAAAPPPNQGLSTPLGPGLSWGTWNSRYFSPEQGNRPLHKSSSKTKDTSLNIEGFVPGPSGASAPQTRRGIGPVSSGAATPHSSAGVSRTSRKNASSRAAESAGPSSSRRDGQPTGTPPISFARQSRQAEQQETARASDVMLASAGSALPGEGAAGAGISEVSSARPHLSRNFLQFLYIDCCPWICQIYMILLMF